jgi:hypothetical protein
VAGIGGMGYMLKKTMESVDQVAKMSDELHISTEALTGLEHAAKISGTSIESLHKGIGIFVRRMGEAKYGVGEGVRGLKMLNLTAEEMIAMGTDEAFMEIAKRISEAGTAAEQAGIAYNFFGRQGTQLLNMFQQGREGIMAMREEAERLGLTFSRWDAARVEAANDALTRARAVLTGIFRQAAIQLSPYIEALADKFVDVSTAGEGLGANVVNIFELMSLAAVRFGGFVQAIPAYWKGVEAGGRETLAVIYDLAAAATNLDVLFKKLELPGWEKTYKELADEQRRLAEGLKEAGGRELAGTYGQENAVKRFYNYLRKQADEWQRVYQTKAKQRAETGYQVETEAQRKAAEEVDRVWTEMWLKEEEAAYHAMRAPIIEAEKLARESAERRKRIAEDIASAMASSWTNAIDRMMFEGQKFWDAMESMARSLIRMIAQIVIYKKFAEPFAYGIMGLPIPGTTAAAAAPMPGQSIASSGLPFWPAGSLQYGGTVEKTGWAKVHRGETFSGVGRGGFDVHIHNEGKEKLEISRVESYMVSDQRIIDVTTRAMQTDVRYRRNIAQIK